MKNRTLDHYNGTIHNLWSWKLEVVIVQRIHSDWRSAWWCKMDGQALSPCEIVTSSPLVLNYFVMIPNYVSVFLGNNEALWHRCKWFWIQRKYSNSLWAMIYVHNRKYHQTFQVTAIVEVAWRCNLSLYMSQWNISGPTVKEWSYIGYIPCEGLCNYVNVRESVGDKAHVWPANNLSDQVFLAPV